MCEFCEKNEAGNVTTIRSGDPSEWYVDVDESDLYIEYDEYSGTVERRERVVRFRDCRRSFEERGDMWCRGIVGPPVEPDGFCAWGEEKGNE